MPRAKKKAPDKPHLTPADLRTALEACRLAESRIQEEACVIADCSARSGLDVGCAKKLLAHGNTASRAFDRLARKIEEMVGE